MVKITLFGDPGTGTSSVAKEFAKKNDFKFESSGNIFRKLAKDLGYEFYEFTELCRSEPKYDIELDNLIKKFGENNDNFIFDSRLAWYFIKASIKIKLICDFDIRIKRIANRENIPFEKAKEKTILREEIERERYFKLYGIKNMSNDSNFDYIIDTSFRTIEETVKEIEKIIFNFKQK